MRSARGARIRLHGRAVKPTGMVELDLDRRADAPRADRAVEYPTVARRDVGGCGTRGLARRRIREHADDVGRRARDIERVRSYGIHPRNICVRNDGGGRFHRGLARILRESVREHAVLDSTQTNDRECADADQDRGDHERLAAVAFHGIHSMRREALAVTTNRGRPTKPSGTGSV